MKEIWKPVAYWPYEVSSRGRVRNLRSGLILSLSPSGGGYELVRLYDSPRMETFYVHDIVASAFLGEKPSGFDVNHIDGTKGNNRPKNLEYVTRSENHRHAYKSGLMRKKLSLELANRIRELYRSGKASQVLLAKRFGIQRVMVNRICTGRAWM